MAELIMLCGLPSSGKSTYADKLKEQGYIAHSSDELRKELFGSVEVQDKNNDLFEELHKRIKQDLCDGKNVVYDATNRNRKKRCNFLRELRRINCKKKAVVFATPYQDCVDSDKQREKAVGEKVIRNMYLTWETPWFGEGFDEIEVVQRNPISIQSAVLSMFNFNQDNPHHSLSLCAHCEKCAEYLEEITEDALLINAGCLHDIGKVHTKTYTNRKGEHTEYAHYWGHHNAGAYEILNIIPFEDVENTDKLLEMSVIVNFHMHPYLSWSQSERTVEKDKKILGDKLFNNIRLLHEADLFAH